MQKKQEFLTAVTMLESKLTTTRNNLAKENAAREEAQKRLEESLQENVTLKLTLKSLEKALEGNKHVKIHKGCWEHNLRLFLSKCVLAP
jgi:regulator of replication initiation timing